MNEETFEIRKKMGLAAYHMLSAVNEMHAGVEETPQRHADAMMELLSGYWDNPKNHVKMFDNISSSSMIIMDNVQFTSFCEHHLLPFFGVAYIGYLPSEDSKRVIGASKLVRILRCFTNRFQVQERIGEQIVDFLMDELKPDGCICILKAQHMCISSRGAKAVGSFMTTSAIRGSFSEKAVRDEFLSLITLPATLL